MDMRIVAVSSRFISQARASKEMSCKKKKSGKAAIKRLATKVGSGWGAFFLPSSSVEWQGSRLLKSGRLWLRRLSPLPIMIA